MLFWKKLFITPLLSTACLPAGKGRLAPLGEGEQLRTFSETFLLGVSIMGWLKVLRGNLEEKYSWNGSSPSEVQMARKKFDQYMNQGLISCKIVDKGKRGIPLTQFDPEAEEIFMLELADGG